ncbi:Fructosamine kinase-domain-containing protein [Apodospora peruviana]|uniref:protein-ribulosamine 3-kinase n=1 Tax=Apodospora peruviana TaxID=516989 RepID=A0AAE0ICM4_9PEZI|nr:Fructosamine kinase-domain-containing protein [Apodospora peruviana]
MKAELLPTPAALAMKEITARRTISTNDANTQTEWLEFLRKRDSGFPINEAVIEALPRGSTLSSVEPFGFSAHSTTGKLCAKNGSKETLYFVKVAQGERGRVMLHGEFEASKTVYNTMSDFIPKPIGFGKYCHDDHTENDDDRTCYFYISEFIDMDVATAPDPVEFTRKLAHLHKTSRSPTGKFGFHVPTCDGDKPQITDWQESWPVFFRSLFLGVYELDRKRNGPPISPDYERVVGQVAWKVIPRLLGSLRESTTGRPIRPCIIHGDMWEGNMGIINETGRTVLFDAGGYFAHNEMELGHWRCEFSSVFRHRVYVDEYKKHHPPAEPVAEFEDRLRLYCLKGTLNYSSGRVNTRHRRTAYNHMLYLCEKYAPLEGVGGMYDPSVDPWITGFSVMPHSD